MNIRDIASKWVLYWGEASRQYVCRIKSGKANPAIEFHCPCTLLRRCWNWCGDNPHTRPISDSSKLSQSQTRRFAATNSFLPDLGPMCPRNPISTKPYRSLHQSMVTNEKTFVHIDGVSEMHVVVKIAGLVDLESSEIGIPDNLMSGYDLEGSQGDNLAVEIDLMDHNAEAIQLSKTFISDEVVLTKHDILGMVIALHKYLLVLSSEVLIGFVDLGCEFDPRGGQFCKFEIVRTSSLQNYLQKCFLSGELVAPLKDTPSTMQQFLSTPSTRPQKWNSQQWYSWLSLSTAIQRFIFSYEDRVCPMRLTNLSYEERLAMFMLVIIVQVAEISSLNPAQPTQIQAKLFHQGNIRLITLSLVLLSLILRFSINNEAIVQTFKKDIWSIWINKAILHHFRFAISISI